MIDENTDDIVGAIVTAWLAGFSMHYSTFGIVKKIIQENDGDKPGLLTVAFEDSTLEDIQWYYPIKPAIGSKCLVIFPDNKPTRAFATAFSKVDTIKTEIDTLKIEISKSMVLLDFDGNLKFNMSEGKFKLKGNLEIDGDIILTGDIDADGEVTAKKQSTPVKLSTHKHAGPAGPPIPEP